jgi:ABC-type nitrate/sulfonate/bicarbonate transport system permease component
VYYFAAFWSVFAVVYIFAITFATIPQGNIRFADTIIGFLLGTVVATILNFFYGTSKSSQDKTDKMAEMMRGAA